MIEIPKILNHDDGKDYTEGNPGWLQPVEDGFKQKPIIRCNCGWYCGIGLHHVHPDGTVTASFYHTAQDDPGRGCGWHVHLKLLNYDGGEFMPKKHERDSCI